MDIVKINCGGSKMEMEREQAISHFKNGIVGSEGHEQLRYRYIVGCLIKGDCDINDDYAD